ncbi:hypothetical protein HDU98_002421 [Podochytrium sp. JEL0797]|nr:hypothetical protein HDU98_002421 [Podochytrium sp. JEL0797]
MINLITPVSSGVTSKVEIVLIILTGVVLLVFDSVFLATFIRYLQKTAFFKWIADNAKVVAANGTDIRYLLQAKLSYISSELATKLKYPNDVELADGRKFWVGNDFTVADSYLYIVLGWSGYLKVDLSVYPKVQAYHAGIAALEFVKEAHALIAAETPSA